MSKCYSLIRGRAMRVTKLDGCGNPAPGANAIVSTDGFISAQMSSNVEEGEEISVTNAAGNLCVSDTPAPKFKNYGIELELCGVNPDLLYLLTGNPIVYDASGTPEGIGFDVNSDIDLDASGFALEIWTGVPSDACEAGTGKQYGYTIIPFVKGGTLGDFTIENGAISMTVTGAQSKDGSQWGVGPHDVVLDSSGDPGPLLTPLSNKNHLRMILTEVAPPSVEECGGSELGTLATSATAGKPGEPTPNGSYLPDTLADMTGITADPTSAWTPGQYVVLGGGNKASWDGTAWNAGAAV